MMRRKMDGCARTMEGRVLGSTSLWPLPLLSVLPPSLMGVGRRRMVVGGRL